MIWGHLDEQVATWSARLVSEVKVSEEESRKLATKVASDVRFLPSSFKEEIVRTSPISLEARLQELQAFQGWMDAAASSGPSPFVARAQVITQNYICFVYLPESCFEILSRVAPSGSLTKKCAQYLRNGRIRSFRNAIAHANWRYRDDFKAIAYWARQGGNAGEALMEFEVTQEELNFWQSLSRCVAYVTFSNI